MEHVDQIDLFLDVMRTCIRTAWHSELGIDSDDEAVDPAWEEPKLTFAMFKASDYSEDETSMILEIHEDLEAPLTPYPVRLHLNPGCFFVGDESNGGSKVVTLESPTPQAIFTAVEAYYRELGCPETNKVFVEKLLPLTRDGKSGETTIFMGS